MLPLYNPLTHVVSVDWNDDKDITHTLTMNAVDITYFPEDQYTFMKRRLLDIIWVDRGGKLPRDSQLEEIEKEITVEV